MRVTYVWVRAVAVLAVDLVDVVVVPVVMLIASAELRVDLEGVLVDSGIVLVHWERGRRWWNINVSLESNKI